MAKAKQRSKLQEQSDTIRQLQVAIENFEDAEESLMSDIARLEEELRVSNRNLADTRSFLQAQREKLERDCSEAHRLIQAALPYDGSLLTMARNAKNGCPY